MIGEVAIFSGWCVLAAAFGVSLFEKLRDRVGMRIAILDYRLVTTSRLVDLLSIGLIAAEVIVFLSLILFPRAGATVAASLLVVYSLAVGSALMRGLRINCHCGPNSDFVSVRTLLRNALLLADATAVGIYGPDSGLAALASLPLASAMFAGMTLAALLVATAIQGLVVHLRRTALPKPRIGVNA